MDKCCGLLALTNIKQSAAIESHLSKHIIMIGKAMPTNMLHYVSSCCSAGNGNGVAASGD